MLRDAMSQILTGERREKFLMLSWLGQALKVLLGQPLTLPGGEGTAALYVPRVVFDGTKGEELGELHDGHGVLHVLLIGKDEDGSIS